MKNHAKTVECRDEQERDALLARLRRSGTPVFAAVQPREGRPVLRIPSGRGGEAAGKARGGTVTF